MQNNLVSSIYQNPSNAKVGYNVSASRKENKAQQARAATRSHTPRFIEDGLNRAMSVLQTGLLPGNDTRAAVHKALNTLGLLRKEIRQRNGARLV